MELTSAVALARNGAVDWVADISIAPEVASDLKRKGGEGLNIGAGFGTYFYSIVVNKPKLPDGKPNPFFDKRVLDFVLGFNLGLGPLVFRLHFAKPIDTGHGPGVPFGTPNGDGGWVTNFSLGWLYF